MLSTYRFLPTCNRTIAVALLLATGAILPCSARAAMEHIESFPDDISEMRLPAEDPRIAVFLVGQDRAYVLGQMRLFLSNLQRINAALADGNLSLVTQVAALSGKKRNEKDPSRPAGLRDRQPPAYTQYVAAVRASFDDIAQTAAAATVQETLGRVARMMRTCVACHQTFRLTDRPPGDAEHR